MMRSVTRSFNNLNARTKTDMFLSDQALFVYRFHPAIGLSYLPHTGPAPGTQIWLGRTAYYPNLKLSSTQADQI